MAAADIPQDRLVLVSPREPIAGALGVLARESKLPEIGELEQERQQRIWRIRAVISDSIPLAGDGDDAINRTSHHRFLLNQNPLTIYLHSGGRNAVYYDFVANENNVLNYIEVRVESALPSNAVLLARKPINAMLDSISRSNPMPLLIQRLELMSPRNNDVLLYELVLPELRGVRMGPLGGIWENSPFAPYDAIYREALTSSSPFYRFLCAWKMYEGMQRTRGLLRREAERKHIAERLPPEPVLDRDELERIGLDENFLREINTPNQLFGRLTELRDGIAHFLISRGDRDLQVYLADGPQLQIYSAGASALLLYAKRMLDVLRGYYARYLQNDAMRGSILPLVEQRDNFIVRARDHGLE